MAKSILAIDVNAVDTAKIKTLVSLLDKYKEQLPQELVAQLMALADCESFEHGLDYFSGKGLKAKSLRANKKEIPLINVISINPILQRLTINDDKDIEFDYCSVICTNSEKKEVTIEYGSEK